MKTHIERLVLVTNGCPETRPCLEYGTWLAMMLKLPVVLLAVHEPGDVDHPVLDLVKEMTLVLQTAGVTFTVDYRQGNAEELVDPSVQPPGTMVVLGPLGRPVLRRFFVGRSLRHFMEDQLAPILYVPHSRLPIRRILVCLGGLGYSMDVLHAALAVADPLQVSLAFLHVVEPVNLDYPLAQQVEAHWQDLLDTDTPQGRILKQALSEAAVLGMTPDVKLRHGHIVPEIIKEIESGDYDLVCMGSIYSSHGLRHLSLPNVTAEIAETAHCPVLVVRTLQQEAP
jgi:nucleotide-binding universal stress UspA family protein